MTIEQLPRLIYVAFSLYALVLLVTRWQASRVMTQDRRFLLLFFLMELANTVLSGVLKLTHEAHVDIATWFTALTQSFLAAYLYYSIPASFRRAHYRFTRRSRR